MVNDGIHSGHRERVRARALKYGIEGFEDHQVLELLLFYSIAQKDTNELAHRLLAEFGSLAAVLEAKPEALMKIEGIGENSALLLSMMPGIFRKYNESICSKKTIIDSVESAGNYAFNLLMGRQYEAFYVISLSASGEVMNTTKISEGTLDETPTYPRLIIEAALNSKAHSVIITHNHPGGSRFPSQSDINATKKIALALSTVDIELRDHIIVNPRGFFSFKNMQMI